MNRQERREYSRKASKHPLSDKCPLCGKKALFVAIPTHDWLCDVMCELCEGIVYKNVSGLIPKTYTRLKTLQEKGCNE